jgi:hypothetical protein
MKAYRLKPKVGSHQERDGVVYNPGDVCWSETDMAKRFPGKFQYDAEETLKGTPPEESSVPTSQEDQDEDSAGDGALGVDKTEDFPAAKENGLLVFHVKGKGYLLADADTPTTALNDKPLPKKDVLPFAEKYLDG